MTKSKGKSVKTYGNDTGRLFEHESYGMIGVSRVSSGAGRRFFGSSLESVPSYLMITVCRATREHSLSHDRHSGSGQEVIRLRLTPAQYAEMISNPNVGYGVPCTLEHVGMKRCEEPPEVESEASLVREKFAEDLADLPNKVVEGRKEILDMLETTKIPQKAKDVILHSYDKATKWARHGNFDFALTSFQEAVERTVTEAKQEIDAFTTHAVHAAGLEALTEKKALGATGLLEAKDAESLALEFCPGCEARAVLHVAPSDELAEEIKEDAACCDCWGAAQDVLNGGESQCLLTWK